MNCIVKKKATRNQKRMIRWNFISNFSLFKYEFFFSHTHSRMPSNGIHCAVSQARQIEKWNNFTGNSIPLDLFECFTRACTHTHAAVRALYGVGEQRSKQHMPFTIAMKTKTITIEIFSDIRKRISDLHISIVYNVLWLIYEDPSRQSAHSPKYTALPFAVITI